MRLNTDRLRTVITENLRVQRGGAAHVEYVDVSNALGDIVARQNHCIFARRGCGKTLLLHRSTAKLPDEYGSVYLNCEDFKNHSFPNVLIEILDAVFSELKSHLSGWFGKKKKLRVILEQIQTDLNGLKTKDDVVEEQVKEKLAASTEVTATGNANISSLNLGLTASAKQGRQSEIEKVYKITDKKLSKLNDILPRIKTQLREFFSLSANVTSVFVQIDDFYHLNKEFQPHVMDYVHRLCKDVPMYFKVATLKHSSVLYADRSGQPTGVQERHDYQPINIDYTFQDIRKTETSNWRIFCRFAQRAGLTEDELGTLFKGDGFYRLVLAGGGVPRDCLSLFLDLLSSLETDSRIGADEVRNLSKANFERKIEELKADSKINEQGLLMRGVYILRRFCLDKQTNIFLVPERMLQEWDEARNLFLRLLDYRIIHSVGSALTHKSQPGTFQAFMIDVGCYAHMRKLQGRFNAIELRDANARETIRSNPILDQPTLEQLWSSAPQDSEARLKADTDEAA